MSSGARTSITHMSFRIPFLFLARKKHVTRCFIAASRRKAKAEGCGEPCRAVRRAVSATAHDEPQRCRRYTRSHHPQTAVCSRFVFCCSPPSLFRPKKQTYASCSVRRFIPPMLHQFADDRLVFSFLLAARCQSLSFSQAQSSFLYGRLAG